MTIPYKLSVSIANFLDGISYCFQKLLMSSITEEVQQLYTSSSLPIGDSVLDIFWREEIVI